MLAAMVVTQCTDPFFQNTMLSPRARAAEVNVASPPPTTTLPMATVAPTGPPRVPSPPYVVSITVGRRPWERNSLSLSLIGVKSLSNWMKPFIS